jgi:hypothetical protein
MSDTIERRGPALPATPRGWTRITADLRLALSLLVLGAILLFTFVTLAASSLVLALERRLHRTTPWGGES